MYKLLPKQTSMKIDGRKIAAEVHKDLKKEVSKLKKKRIQPHMAVIVIGSDPASLSYVAQKTKAAKSIGAKLNVHRFPTTPLYQQLATFLNELNQDPKVHGIIIQRPLPPTLSADALTKIISPYKDVDGFLEKSEFAPPLGIAMFKILNYVYHKHFKKTKVPKDDFSKALLNWLKSKQIVMLGRGETGGKPIAQTFNIYHIPFIMLNSTVENRDEYLKDADVIISAVGRSNIISAGGLKPGVIILGVGVHRHDDKIGGDFDEIEMEKTMTLYTPTPGGVGPVNVACLMVNLIKAAKLQKKR